MLALIVTAAIGLRFLAMWLARGTVFRTVDEYYVDREAALALISGKNPYALAYPFPGGVISVFAYLPIIAVYYAPFAYFGDVRMGSIAADTVIIVSLYILSRRLFGTESRVPLLASLGYAVFPTSIWLTSVSGNNTMVGAMLILVSLVLVGYNQYKSGAAVLGLALACTQFAFLILPVVAYYYLKATRLKLLSISAATATAVVAPFVLSNPSSFYYQVVVYQFIRPLQSNGWMSLYSIAYSMTGVTLVTPVRVSLFLSLGAVLSWMFLRRRTIRGVLLSSSSILLLGVFVLPVNGFWSYLVVPGALLCAFIPEWFARAQAIPTPNFLYAARDLFASINRHNPAMQREVLAQGNEAQAHQIVMSYMIRNCALPR